MTEGEPGESEIFSSGLKLDAGHGMTDGTGRDLGASKRIDDKSSVNNKDWRTIMYGLKKNTVPGTQLYVYLEAIASHADPHTCI